MDFESETFITHALRGEGFDASEDGTGHGTPLIALPLQAGSGQRGYGVEENYIAFSSKDHGADAGEISPTLRSMGHDGSHANGGGQVAVAIQNATRGKEQNGLGISDDGSMYTLDQGSQHGVAIALSGRARGDDGRGYERAEHHSEEIASTLDGVKVDRVLGPSAMAVRRLTPRECERLQGFPDDYTKISDKTADGPRYKALGNSMAVPCMKWIGERIQMVEDLSK
jgi:DNA (cytosine-5)-methyltransferase 1